MNCVFKNQTRNKIWKEYYPLLETLAGVIEEQCHVNKDAVVSVILVKSKKIHEINKLYRNIDKSTDVITFAAQEGDSFAEEELLELGDVFINVDAVEQQAKEYDHSIQREIGFLFVHGVLHTLGYDHQNEEEEEIMFELQRKLLDPVIPR